MHAEEADGDAAADIESTGFGDGPWLGAESELAGSDVDESVDYETQLAECNADAVRLLARQAKSSGELRDALLQRDHDRSVVADVIDEFERALYLDDTGLARAVSEKLRETKRASRGQIRMKLRERQVRDDIIEAVLGELDDEQEYELLREAAEERARKLRGLDRQTAERRLMGFLARRGWSGEALTRATREALDTSVGASGSREVRRGSAGRSPGGAARGSGVSFK